MNKNKAMFFTAINYGVYPSLIILLTTTPHLHTINKVLLGFIVVGAKELFTWFSLNFYIGPSNVYKCFKLIGTKQGFISACAGVIGGPLGYILLTISSLYVGSALASLLMCLNTPLSFLLETIFLKRKLSLKLLISCFLSLSGGILIILTSSNDFKTNTHFFIGICLILLVIVAWTFESIIIDKFLKEDNVIDEYTTISLKLTSSVIVLVFILIPLISFVTTNNTLSGIISLKEYFLDIHLLIPIGFIGISMLCARLSYIYCIKYASATHATIAYNLSTLVTPALIIVINIFFKTNQSGDIKLIFSWQFIVSLTLMLSSAFLAANSKPKQTTNK